MHAGFRRPPRRSLAALLTILLSGLVAAPAAAEAAREGGVCFEGSFVGNDAARRVSKASLFSGQSFAVVGSLSVAVAGGPAGGHSHAAGALAFQVTLPEDEAFVVSAHSGDAAASAGAPRLPAPLPASYATTRYFGADPLIATNADHKSRRVAWLLEPDAVATGSGAGGPAAQAAGRLAADLAKRVALANVSFDMWLQVAPVAAASGSASIAPPERRSVPAGRLMITRVAAGSGAPCRDAALGLLRLPRGLSADLAAPPAGHGVRAADPLRPSQ